MDYEAGRFSDLADTKTGRALWKFLNEHDSVLIMETATHLGKPALAPMGDRLLEEFGAEIKADRWKQMIGHMVRQVMERKGYRHDVVGMKVKSPLFSRASRYKKV
jgi:hypothetical protein